MGEHPRPRRFLGPRAQVEAGGSRGEPGRAAGRTIVNVVAFAVPLVLGFSATSFVVMMFCFGIGAGFCGESIYKVWSQELFPTLLRSTAQGSRSRSPGSWPDSRRSARP